MERLGSNYTSRVVRVNFKILESVRDEFREICEKNGSTVSDTLRFLMEDYIEHMQNRPSHHNSYKN